MDEARGAHGAPPGRARRGDVHGRRVRAGDRDARRRPRRVAAGAHVAVLGVGPVGQSIIALSALSGRGRIFAIGDPPSRLAFAARMGATDTIGLDLTRRPARCGARGDRWARGGHRDRSERAPDAVLQAFDLVRDGGRIVICGHYTDAATSASPTPSLNREARRGSRLLGQRLFALPSRR